MPLSSQDIAALSPLLDQAMELGPDERDAWIDALSDRRLATLLREMLATRERTLAAGFLAALPDCAAADDSGDDVPRAGERVGPYRLLREIGRGGMGDVWLAERPDGGVRRQVALKLPRLAWGAGLAERMAREREIGALLEHPAIARLYDAGVDERGRPWLAFELIVGRPIDAWCEGRALPVADRLALVVEVARAVGYAHGRLVVHRDLKPSNVLVSDDGRAHLLDFGIAKLLQDGVPDEPGLTRELGRVLTPHYASPEQMRGEPVTVQSDVYSLGVLAYRLLTGQMPYAPRRDTLAALEEAVLESEPVLPSRRAATRQLARQLEGEVDAILAKAMQRDPARRYATAEAFADDVERHLAGEAVLARGDGAGYRLLKFARRHRVALATTCAVLAGVVGGSVVAVQQARRAMQAAQREQVVKAFVTDIFRINLRADPSNGPLRQLPAERLLEHGAGLIEHRFPGEPELQAELYGVVQGIFANMGANGLAAEYASRQSALLAGLRADDALQGRALLNWATALLESQRAGDAEARAKQAFELAHDDDALAGEALVLLARAQEERGSRAESLAVRARAQRLLDRTRAPRSIATVWLTYLRAYDEALDNRFDQAQPLYLRAIADADAVEGHPSRTAAVMRLRLADKLLGLHRQAEALAQIEPGLAALEELGGADAIRAAAERAELWAEMNIFRAVAAGESLRVVRRSREQVRSLAVAVPTSIRARIDLAEASVLIDQGRIADADALLAASPPAGDIEQSRWSRYMQAVVSGELAARAGRHDQADDLFRRAIELRLAMGHGKFPFTVWNYDNQAFNAVMAGRLDHAQAILDSMPTFDANRGDATTSTETMQAVAWQRARLQLMRGDAPGALQRMAALDDGDDKADNGSWDALRAEAQCAAGQAAEGLSTMKEVVKARAARADDIDPVLARDRAVAGLCALDVGDRRLAAGLASQARSALVRQPGVSGYYEAPLNQLERRLRGR